MPDLFERFVVALETIAKNGIVANANGKTASAPAATAPKDKPAASTPDKAAAANKAAAAAAGNKGGGKGAAATAPVSGTKAPQGKHTIDDVREILRQVATKPGLGRQSALDILDENGGVDHLNKLKPENFDAVHEAAEVALKGGEASDEGSDESDDGLGLS